MGKAYTSLRSALSPSAATQVASDQRDSSSIPEPTSSRSRTSPEPSPTPPTTPALGTGVFSSPQIDNQIDSHDDRSAAWNRPVIESAPRLRYGQRSLSHHLRLHRRRQHPDQHLLQPARRQPRLIVLDLGNTTCGYGATHPNTSVATFSWWLDQKRSLAASDIFAANSAWRTDPVTLLAAKLKTQLTGFFVDNAESRKTIAQILASTEAWDVSDSGFTLTFGQYAIAPTSQAFPPQASPGSSSSHTSPQLRSHEAPSAA
jgi:hypothetical protein